MPRLAVAQTPGTELAEWRATLELLEDFVHRAAAERANVVLLPECAWPAYFIGTRAAYFAARSTGLPGPDEFLQRVCAWARATRISICIGFVAEHDRRLYNAAALISAAGELLGVQHKCFLWDFDHDWFEPGQSLHPTDTPFGRAGMMICADARLPEIPATLAARGAELLLQPTAWVQVGTPGKLWNPQPDFLIRARALEFGVPIASASKCGAEGDTTFVGSSLICDSDGDVLTQCGQREPGVIAADVEFSSPRSHGMTQEQSAALLAEQPPRIPAANVPPLKVILAPQHPAASPGSAPPPSTTCGPCLILSPPATQTATTSRSASTNAELVGASCIRLHGPTTNTFQLGEIRLAAVSADQTRGFAPLRALALDGVHAVVAFGAPEHAALLQTRASENRFYVLAASDRACVVYDPTGKRTTQRAWPRGAASTSGQADSTFTLEPGQSADKQVAPRTDMLRGRAPRSYEW